MSLIEMLFKKKLKELNLEDLQNYFQSEKKEAHNVEFKSYDQRSKRDFKDRYDDILKVMCAMLNTEGGIIIWGAPVGVANANEKEKSFKLPLAPVPHKIEEDQFTDKISGRITPLCKGVAIHL